MGVRHRTSGYVTVEGTAIISVCICSSTTWSRGYIDRERVIMRS